ncbi:hypothetical protein D3C71_1786710 [compost metagenome]
MYLKSLNRQYGIQFADGLAKCRLAASLNMRETRVSNSHIQARTLDCRCGEIDVTDARRARRLLLAGSRSALGRSKGIADKGWPDPPCSQPMSDAQRAIQGVRLTCAVRRLLWLPHNGEATSPCIFRGVFSQSFLLGLSA